jgi:acyl-CoA thioesterase
VDEPTTTFDRTTALGVGAEDGTFAVELDASWSSLRGLHGGYLAAIMTNAAEAVSPGRAVRTSTTSFLRPSRPGPATVRVSPVRSGRTIATIAVEVEQRSRTIAVSRLTLAQPSDSSTLEPGAVPVAAADHEWEAPFGNRPPARDACEVLTPPPGIAHFGQASAWYDPAHTPFTSSERARVAGHVRPLDARPIDASWLTMILDWFPPAPFVRLPDPSVGGVSIDYTVHIHRTSDALPDDEWLEATFDAPTSHGGMAVEHGRIGTSTGDTVAESFHTRWMR